MEIQLKSWESLEDVCLTSALKPASLNGFLNLFYYQVTMLSFTAKAKMSIGSLDVPLWCMVFLPILVLLYWNNRHLINLLKACNIKTTLHLTICFKANFISWANLSVNAKCENWWSVGKAVLSEYNYGICQADVSLKRNIRSRWFTFILRDFIKD